MRKKTLTTLFTLALTLLTGFCAETDKIDHELSIGAARHDLCLKPYTDFLQGPNLFLRPVFPDDYRSFISIYTDPVTMRYFGRGITISVPEIKERILNRAIANRINDASYHWSLITHDGIAGIISVWYPDTEEPLDELAYCLAPRFSGRGLTTDGSRLVIDFISKPFVATVHPDNIASVKVLEKLGFKKDPTRLGVPKYGSVRDYYVRTTH